MKLLKSPANCHEAFAPAFILFKLFGIAPISYEGPRGLGKLVMKQSDIVYSIFLICLHSSVNFMFYCENQDFDDLQMSGILTIAWQVLYHYIIFSKSICILRCCFRRREIMNFLKLIEEFDKKVS